ncbi:MAG: hypothetical protein AAF184_17415 [Pseudomonadota bacterium]
MRVQRRYRPVLAGILCLAVASPGQANLAGDERVRVMVMDESVMVTTLITADALLTFDRDGDGQLSRLEFDAQHDAILHWAEARFVLETDDGQALAAFSRRLPSLEYVSATGGAAIESVRVLLRYRLPAPLQAGRLDVDLLGSAGERRDFVVWMAQPPRYGSIEESGGVIDLRTEDALYR